MKTKMKPRKKSKDQKLEEGEQGEFAPYMDEEEDEEDMEKSLSVEQLEGAIERLEKALQVVEPSTIRKDELLQKSIAGEATAQDNAELASLLNPADGSLREELTKSLQEIRETAELRKSLDAAPVLSEFQDSLVKSLGNLADRIEDRDSEDSEFRVALTKSLIDMGGVIEAQSEQIAELTKSIQSLGSQPAHAPTSMRHGANPLEKSFADGQGQPTQDRGKILDNISKKIQGGQRQSAQGHNLNIIAAQIESGGFIAPEIAQEFGS